VNRKDGTVEEFFPNNNGIKILTPAGWSDFAGVVKKSPMNIIRIECDDSQITCTPDHEIYSSINNKIEAKDLNIGDHIFTKIGFKKISKIINENLTDIVYDLISVEDGNKFYANDILVSNCKFITADETLIAPAKLLKLQGVEPIGKTHNQVRWYETISPNKTYLVSLDPSSGVGRDSSVIQVFCLPDMTQVAEWSHNRTSPSQQVKLMKSIINYIYSEMKQSGMQKGEPEICYTFENNAVGEAIIVGLQELGEDSIAGQLINEPKVRGVSNRRKGLNTNVRSKIQSCTRLKSLVESDKIKLYSKLLIRQLKFFVAKGDSFGGKGGEHDDTVSALLLCVRMMQIAMSWDDSIADLLRDTGDNDEFEEPMPIFVMRR